MVRHLLAARGLVDVWRRRYPDVRQYTNTMKIHTTPQRARLDMFLVTPVLAAMVAGVGIEDAADHDSQERISDGIAGTHQPIVVEMVVSALLQRKVEDATSRPVREILCRSRLDETSGGRSAPRPRRNGARPYRRQCRTWRARDG